MASTPSPAGGDKPCPICGKPASPSYRPFCSRRCADVDLNRWLSGGYVIPGAAEPEEDTEEAPLAPAPPRPR
ncbi:DNA gyrase inhibitor YacG [Ancylobacter terrae]|uniref:DNA gyrase inhibitor YacG n=1 Tax=Ancylobacter sp. sgz301288 TaxID=3342077 RepID=UPI00385E8C8A